MTFRSRRVMMGWLSRFCDWLDNLTPEAFVGLALLLAFAFIGILFAFGWRGDS